MTTLQQLKQKKIKEFDRKFPNLGEYSYPDHDIAANHGEDGECISCPIEARGDLNHDIKLFLSSAMDKIQNATIKAAQEILPKKKEVEWLEGTDASKILTRGSENYGFNFAISQSYSALNNLKTK